MLKRCVPIGHDLQRARVVSRTATAHVLIDIQVRAAVQGITTSGYLLNWSWLLVIDERIDNLVTFVVLYFFLGNVYLRHFRGLNRPQVLRSKDPRYNKRLLSILQFLQNLQITLINFFRLSLRNWLNHVHRDRIRNFINLVLDHMQVNREVAPEGRVEPDCIEQ